MSISRKASEKINALLSAILENIEPIRNYLPDLEKSLTSI